MTYMLIPVDGLIEVFMTDTDPTRVLTTRDGQGPLIELNLTVDNTDVGKAFTMTEGPDNPRAREAMNHLTNGVHMVFRGPALFSIPDDNTIFDLLRTLP